MKLGQSFSFECSADSENVTATTFFTNDCAGTGFPMTYGSGQCIDVLGEQSFDVDCQTARTAHRVTRVRDQDATHQNSRPFGVVLLLNVAGRPAKP